MSQPGKSDIQAFLDGFTHDPAFLARYPYYAAVLARLVPVADPSVARMAVSPDGGRFYLHVNVDGFLAEVGDPLRPLVGLAQRLPKL